MSSLSIEGQFINVHFTQCIPNGRVLSWATEIGQKTIKTVTNKKPQIPPCHSLTGGLYFKFPDSSTRADFFCQARRGRNLNLFKLQQSDDYANKFQNKISLYSRFWFVPDSNCVTYLLSNDVRKTDAQSTCPLLLQLPSRRLYVQDWGPPDDGGRTTDQSF